MEIKEEHQHPCGWYLAKEKHHCDGDWREVKSAAVCKQAYKALGKLKPHSDSYRSREVQVRGLVLIQWGKKMGPTPLDVVYSSL